MYAVSGSTDKSDVIIRVERIEDGLKLDISSTVSVFFSDQQQKLIRKTLVELHENNLYVSVNDNQALDFVLKARLKASVSALREKEGQL